jgi:hypothetical protein
VSARLIASAAVGGLAYGAVMGAFGGLGGDRGLQVAFAAVKVPLLLLATLALTLPAFFVVNSLAGLRDDFPEVLRALAAAQAVLAIALAAFAPYTALWYASTANYHEALLFNAAMFAAASVAAQLLLRRLYRPLIARRPRHRHLLRGWLVLYAFVGVQMGWVLRPFVGEPGRPVTFFRADTWGNAYLEVLGLIAGEWKR